MLDSAEVVGQVVLGEQVDQQRRAHGVVELGAGEVGIVLAPHLTFDRVTTTSVWNVFVGEPLL